MAKKIGVSKNPDGTKPVPDEPMEECPECGACYRGDKCPCCDYARDSQCICPMCGTTYSEAMVARCPCCGYA
jgi:hypothetical protein